MITSGRRSTRLTRGSRLIPKKSFRESSSSRLRNPRSLYPPDYPLVLDWFFHLQTCRKTSQCELETELDHHPRRHSSSKKRLEELEVRKLEMQLQLASLDRQVPSTNPTALDSSAKSLGVTTNTVLFIYLGDFVLYFKKSNNSNTMECLTFLSKA